MRQDRRRFCGSALGMLALGAATSLPATRGDLADLAALFRHPESARRIGRRLLARPGLPAEAALRETAMPVLRELAAADGRQARSVLRRHAARDYAAGDIVLVEGWVLSRTEAHLCALLALA